MLLTFYKYHGTGNDFVMVDNRTNFFPKENKLLIEKLCDRRFGIGADGLILIENDTEYDFKMVYYNSDGAESTMCGNGGRCSVAFTKQLGIIANNCSFNAIDGLHTAVIEDDNRISLQMKDVKEIINFDNNFFLDTGSPHHIKMVDDVVRVNVYEEGKKIRESKLYAPNGTNVNFVQQINNNTFKIRTYERGVEDETLSCGTGATAVALAMHSALQTRENNVVIEVEGGTLEVKFNSNGKGFTDVFLKGPAICVYKGEIEI